MVPATVVNPGVVQQVSGPAQTPPQGQFQYPGPWFPVGRPPIAMHQPPPSGFIPTSNPSGPIFNNPPHLPSPSFTTSNMPSLFGPRPSQTAGFGSVLQSPSPVSLRPQSMQMLQQQQPYMHQAYPPMLAQQPLPAQHYVSAPPFMSLLPQPVPDQPMAPAGGSMGWPRAPLGAPASLGLNQMVQMTPSMVPPQGHHRPVIPRPVVSSIAQPSNISVPNMVSPGNFPSHSSAPQLLRILQNHPVPGPNFASSVPSPHMGLSPSPTAPVSLPAAPMPPAPPLTTLAPMHNPSPKPVLGPVPVPSSSMPSSTPTPPPQFGIPVSVSGGIPGFTSIRPPPVAASPMLQRPSSGDFTFQPQQAVVPLPPSSTQPTNQNPPPPNATLQPPMAPQPPSFRVAVPPFPRPRVNNQMGVPHSQIPAPSFPGSPMSAPLRPPPFQSPSPAAAIIIPVSQRGPGSGPGNFNPVRQISNLPGGPFPPRPGNAMQLNQNFPARPGNPSAPNQLFGSMPFAPPKPGSGPHGVVQIYDPFSPTSVPHPPQQQQQQGGNLEKVRKQENDPEYDDLMASVGVK